MSCNLRILYEFSVIIQKQFLSRISALFAEGEIFLSEKRLKEFENHIHLVKMIYNMK